MQEQVERERGNGDWGGQRLRELASSETLSELDEQLRTFVRERPFVAVAAAVAAGFVLGRLLSRT